jgi:malonate transporter
VLGYAVTRKLLGQDRMTAAFSAMGMSCPNSGFVGYPIMLLTFPSIAGTVLALNMFVEKCLHHSGAADACRTRQGAAEGHPLAGSVPVRSERLAVNPLVIGLSARLLVLADRLAAAGLSMVKSVDLFASVQRCPVAVLHRRHAGRFAHDGLAGRIVPIVIGKLIAHPADHVSRRANGRACARLRADPVAVARGACPFGGHAALRHLSDPRAAIWRGGLQPPSRLLATTIVSFLTISGLLWVVSALTGMAADQREGIDFAPNCLQLG